MTPEADNSENSWIRQHAWLPPDSLPSGSYVFRIDPNVGRPDWSPRVFYDPAFSDPPTTRYLVPRTAVSSPVRTTTLDERIIAEEHHSVLHTVPYANARPGATPSIPIATKGVQYPSLVSAAALAMVTNVDISSRPSAYPSNDGDNVCVARHPLINARPCAKYV